jgi:prepilin-type N-terminal cleavage/methylation domain-containing protein
MGEPRKYDFLLTEKTKGNRRQAFSLVELLVVLGIIALLIALLMPVLAKARAQSKYIACQSNLRQIGQMMIIYANNNGGWLFPYGGIEEDDVRQRWFIYVLKPRTPLDPNSQNVQDWTPPIMLCPADDPNPGNYHSYVLNHHLMEHNIRYSSHPPGGITADHAVVAGEKKTTETYYFIETFDGPPPYSTYEQEIETYRHGVGLGSNYLYLDMHVDPHGPVETLYGMDPWDLPNAPTTLPTN